VRHDDIEALIRRVERERGNRSGKIMQEWHGSVAASVADGAIAAGVLEALSARKNSRWLVIDLAYGAGWVSFRGVYTAKGANANDADTFVRRHLDVNPGDDQVAVDTNRITPVTTA
jgi:hypothetical protein